MTDSDPHGTRHTDTQQAKRAAEELRTEAGSAATDAANAARDYAARKGGQARDAAAGEVSNISSALRKAAEEAREGSAQERTFGQMAEALADISDNVRDRDMAETIDDVTHFARRNPLAFLGGAALLGFAATRFARASDPRGRTRRTGAPARAEGAPAPAPAPARPETVRPATPPTTPGV